MLPLDKLGVTGSSPVSPTRLNPVPEIVKDRALAGGFIETGIHERSGVREVLTLNLDQVSEIVDENSASGWSTQRMASGHEYRITIAQCRDLRLLLPVESLADAFDVEEIA